VKPISLSSAKVKPISLLLALAVFPSLAPRSAGAGEAAERYQGPEGRFEHPAGWKVERGADVSAEIALKLIPPDGERLQSAVLLIGAKRIGDGELEAASAEWHSAHLRNRAAWGMHLTSGLPREEVRAGGRRALRFRDRVGGALGSSEQTFTCALASAHLACILITAPADARDSADAFTAQIFSSLSLASKSRK
jgi:hypothetical protein